jgi:hypothetical protein
VFVIDIVENVIIDICFTLQELDFEEFLPQMEKFLEQHRNSEKTKKEEKERLKAAAATAKKGEDATVETNDNVVEGEEGADETEAVDEGEVLEKNHPRDETEEELTSPSKKQKKEDD